ncbi:hypothetical protein GCM10010279_03630 [Streptomyces mutabilis]|nr:hypothetical protein GCM10010279_03630 [Streptomyces mutabilis]
MQLLGNDLAGPVRGAVVVDALETEEEPVLAVDAREVGVRVRVPFPRPVACW